MPRPGGAGRPEASGRYDLVPGDEGYDALADLWSRLARPCSMLATVSALTGLSRPATGELLGSVVATSPEAERLLDELPRTIRSLATAIDAQAERCIGELRGPVLWSETLSARASSFGDPDLYICATPSRAYDIDQNRVLVAALLAVRDAARDAVEHTGGHQRYQEAEVRAAIRNGNDAARFVEHPSLARVKRSKPTPRALKRTRTGKKRTAYEPALAVLDRVAEPLTLDQLRGVCDRRTRAQHALLLGVVHRLERDPGNRLPPFRVESGALWAGPVQYRHPRGAGEASGVAGVVVGDVLVDVPARLGAPDRRRDEAALARRWTAGPVVVATDDADVDRAVALAVARATGHLAVDDAAPSS